MYGNVRETCYPFITTVTINSVKFKSIFFFYRYFGTTRRVQFCFSNDETEIFKTMKNAQLQRCSSRATAFKWFSRFQNRILWLENRGQTLKDETNKVQTLIGFFLFLFSTHYLVIIGKFYKNVMDWLLKRTRRVWPTLYRSGERFFLREKPPAAFFFNRSKCLARKSIKVVYPAPRIWGSGGLFFVFDIKTRLKGGRGCVSRTLRWFERVWMINIISKENTLSENHTNVVTRVNDLIKDKK